MTRESGGLGLFERPQSRSTWTLTPIPAFSDRDQLIERVVPMTADGRVILPRRSFLGQLGMCTAGAFISAGCEDLCNGVDQQLGQLLVALIELLFKAIGIGDFLPTATTLLNDSGSDFSFRAAFDLVGVGDTCRWIKGEDSPIMTIPPGKFELRSDGAGISPEASGKHHIDVSASESKKSSSNFSVKRV